MRHDTARAYAAWKRWLKKPETKQDLAVARAVAQENDLSVVSNGPAALAFVAGATRSSASEAKVRRAAREMLAELRSLQARYYGSDPLDLARWKRALEKR